MNNFLVKNRREIFVIKIYFILFFLCLSFFNYSQQKPEEIITIKESHNKLDIYYGGKIRLEGGHIILQSKNILIKKITEENNVFSFLTSSRPINVSVKSNSNSPVICFFLSPNGNESKNGKDFLGIFFDKIPGFEKGMTLWRYGPWNSWSKPERIEHIMQMKAWDVQFFYWQYSDGMFGAAMPLSGKGYRTILGQENGLFGSKSVSYFNKMNEENIPQIAVGFGKDPYKLFAELYKEGLTSIGKEDDLILGKSFPKIFDSIGWCSWNASNEGKNLNDSLLINSAKNFVDAKFPVKWFLIDDGWFDNTESKLNSFYPDKKKFPNGFSPIIKKLKEEFGINNVGIWSTLNGYWQGINPNSELGREFKKDLFSWKEKIRPDLRNSKMRDCYFIKPDSRLLNKFYDDFYSYLKEQGCSFVKIDNQLVTERMAVDNFPIFKGSEKYHEAINSAVAKFFDNTIINCMDMTPEAYLNFGNTSVARAEDDYYPAYDTTQSYDFVIQKASDQIMQASFNSLYFSQMVFPDLDMFESISPSAAFHAFTHAIGNGPIYITDKVNEHNFKVLEPLVYSDGKILRADKPLLPMVRSLFQKVGEPFQAFSMDGDVALVGTWETAKKDSIVGRFRPNEIPSLYQKQFAVYEYFSKEYRLYDRDETIPYKLYERAPYKLFYLVPTSHGCAIFGLVNKYNAPAAVLNSSISINEVTATIYEGGTFAAYTRRKPASVLVNGKEHAFNYFNGLLTIDISVDETPKPVNIDIKL
jgi:hypothetical protein